jgi:Mg/Co/Ni transporter MgtE|tara:strand:+ start:1588 stop:1914 length:327 start_codon:yes stop_codon:yes gene_type:complete
MEFGTGIFSGLALAIISLIIIITWVLIEVKRVKHKLFAIFLVVAIIFLYWGAIVVFQGEEVDLKSYSGVMEAGNLYFSWMVSIFGNFKIITGNIIHMDWSGENKTRNT